MAESSSSGGVDKLHFEHCNQDGDDRYHSNRREVQEDPFLQMLINSIMRKAVREPHNAMITPDARETLRACVTRFTTFITSKAEQKCELEERPLITEDDIFYAMSTAGVYHYMKDVNRSLRKYRSGPTEKRGEGLITNRSREASSAKKEEGKKSATPEFVAPKCMPRSALVADRRRESEDSAVPSNVTRSATAADREKSMWTLWLSTLVAKGWGVPIFSTKDYATSPAAPRLPPRLPYHHDLTWHHQHLTKHPGEPLPLWSDNAKAENRRGGRRADENLSAGQSKIP